MQLFINGVKQNHLHPQTFEIPSDEEKSNIQIGDYVKVGFVLESSEDLIEAERMWLRVTEINNKIITGTLSNDPVCLDYEFGDTFTVTLDEVLSVYKE